MEQSPKAVLVVVCGIPASGKSHLCGELRKILVGEKENPIVFVVSYDVIIPMVTPDQWKSQRRDLLQAISLLIRTHRGCDGESFSGKNDEEQRSTKMAAMILQENAHSSASSNPLIVILDDNMYYRSMRYEVYQLAAALETGFCQIFLEIEPEIAKRRNERRSSPVPERVMDRIDRLMEGPDVKKNKFERYSHLLDCPWEETGLEAVVDLIERALKDPVRAVDPAEAARLADEKTRARETNQSNLHHYADLILRHLVHEKQKSCDVGIEMRTANQCRKIVFQNFKKLDLEFFEPDIHRDLIERFLTDQFESLYTQESLQTENKQSKS